MYIYIYTNNIYRYAYIIYRYANIINITSLIEEPLIPKLSHRASLCVSCQIYGLVMVTVEGAGLVRF